jgi:hypothetical protein
MADTLAVGTVLAAGDPAPPTNTEKATSAGIWVAIPALLAIVSMWVSSAPSQLPAVDPGVWQFITAVLTLVTPLAGWYGAYRKSNTLTQPVKVISAPGQVVDPPVVGM